MPDESMNDTSGKPIYEQNSAVPEKTISSAGPKFEDKSVRSYSAEDVGKYQMNKPIRDIIYAKIVKREVQEIPCIISEETKTTE